MNGNQLKAVALVAMTVDHIGYILFPQVVWLRVVGRLAFPIFAFMVAEGCFYTRSRRRYLLLMCACALVIQIGYWLALHSLYQSIMTTLALAVATVLCLQRAAARRTAGAVAGAAGVLMLDAWACLAAPGALGHGFGIDYGLAGVLLPAFAYLPHLLADARTGGAQVAGFGEEESPGGGAGAGSGAGAGAGTGDDAGAGTGAGGTPARRRIDARTRHLMLLAFSAGLVFLCAALDRPDWHVQWFSLLALALLALYDGTRGKLHMKYLFYIYYPAHLAAIYSIGMLCDLA